MDSDRFSQRAGHYPGEIKVLHPFREGNGRSKGEFIAQLARTAGLRIDWRWISQADMTGASIEACNGDSWHLASLIRAGLPMSFPNDRRQQEVGATCGGAGLKHRQLSISSLLIGRDCLSVRRLSCLILTAVRAT